MFNYDALNSLKTKAILIAVDDGTNSDFSYMLSEMKNLITACDMEIVTEIVQYLPSPNPSSYIGKGKLSEVANIADYLGVSYCVFADNLSPTQLKNITNIVSIGVFDRTGLILEIFAKRAKTREAKLQVEAANLQYMLPRLIGMRESLGRQAGASGALSNKGQGEKQLELDRRHIEKRISELNRELNNIEHDRTIQRAKRNKKDIPSVALVGYTNAGKSTLMNYFLEDNNFPEEKKVFEKDMLFATLDTTVRRIHFKDNKDFLLSDTVGFVSNLPHSLIKAFRTTLAEIEFADLILIVLDASDEQIKKQLEVTETTLEELDLKDIPKIYVLNKIDKLENYNNEMYFIDKSDEKTVLISAKNGYGISDMLNMIKETLYGNNITAEFNIPYSRGYLNDLIYTEATVIETKYTNDGTYFKANLSPSLIGIINNDIKSI